MDADIELMDDLRSRMGAMEEKLSQLRSDAAVLKTEVRLLRTQLDNMRVANADLPQRAMTIISLVLMALMFLVNLRVAGVL